jgi:Rod binding domain-containing protein
MTTPAAVSAPILDPAPPQRPKDAESAAREFEAVLIGQMLRSAREAAEDDDTDTAGETMVDLADQQFSRMLASGNGLGIARVITAGLKEAELKTGEQDAHQ